MVPPPRPSQLRTPSQHVGCTGAGGHCHRHCHGQKAKANDGGKENAQKKTILTVLATDNEPLHVWHRLQTPQVQTAKGAAVVTSCSQVQHTHTLKQCHDLPLRDSPPLHAECPEHSRRCRSALLCEARTPPHKQTCELTHIMFVLCTLHCRRRSAKS